MSIKIGEELATIRLSTSELGSRTYYLRCTSTLEPIQYELEKMEGKKVISEFYGYRVLGQPYCRFVLSDPKLIIELPPEDRAAIDFALDILNSNDNEDEIREKYS